MRRQDMKHMIPARLGLAATILALPLLAACTPDDDAPSSAAPDASETPTTPAPTTLDPSLAADSEFCELAVDTIPVADQITEKTAGMQTLLSTALTTGDITAVNTWGNELADLDAQMLDFYAAGRPYIEGESVEGSWDLMESFVRDYSHELARTAATAPDTDSFVGAIAELTTREGITDLLTNSPTAAQEIHDYINDRCGVVG